MANNLQEAAHAVIVWAEEENPYFSGSMRCGCPRRNHGSDCVIQELRNKAYGPRGSEQADASQALLQRIADSLEKDKPDPMGVDQDA